MSIEEILAQRGIRFRDIYCIATSIINLYPTTTTASILLKNALNCYIRHATSHQHCYQLRMSCTTNANLSAVSTEITAFDTEMQADDYYCSKSCHRSILARPLPENLGHQCAENDSWEEKEFILHVEIRGLRAKSKSFSV